MTLKRDSGQWPLTTGHGFQLPLKPPKIAIVILRKSESPVTYYSGSSILSAKQSHLKIAHSSIYPSLPGFNLFHSSISLAPISSNVICTQFQPTALHRERKQPFLLNVDFVPILAWLSVRSVPNGLKGAWFGETVWDWFIIQTEMAPEVFENRDMKQVDTAKRVGVNSKMT